MKKKYIIMILIIIFVSALMISGCQLLNAKSEGDELIEEWLVENIQEADAYQFELISTIMYDEPNVVDGVVKEIVLPDGIPNIFDHYTVTIFKSAKKAKIEFAYSEYYYQGRSTNETEMYTDKVYYISVENDTVFCYQPDASGNYTVQTYQDQELADAMSALLFPEDVAFLQGDVIQSIFSKDNNPYLQLERVIQAQTFYLPFQRMIGEAVDKEDFYVNFSLMQEPYISQWVFSIFTMRVNDYCATVYEAMTGKPYTNVMIENGYSYDTIIELYFYEDRFDVTDFDLPDVK